MTKSKKIITWIKTKKNQCMKMMKKIKNKIVQKILKDYSDLHFLNKRKIDDKKRTAEFSFMSDEPVERDFGIESIDVTKTDMSFVSSGRAPLLLDHDTKAQIGVIEKAEIVNGKGRAVARFGKSQLANEVFEDVKSGIRQNISVGYQIKEMDKVDDEDEKRSPGRDFSESELNL